MGLAEDRAALMAANVKLGEALAMAMATVQSVEEATGLAASAIQGYDAVELVEATGMIAAASEHASDTAREISAAQTSIDNYVARMS